MKQVSETKQLDHKILKEFTLPVKSLKGEPGAWRQVYGYVHEWGFKGYVIFDVVLIYKDQKYVKSPEDAIGDVLKVGMDINCGTYFLRHIKSTVKSGKMREDMNGALLNLLCVRLYLGLFDGNSANRQIAQLGPGNVCTHEHKKLALVAARQGVVLLKNENSFLPMGKNEVASLAIIGPAASDTSILVGNYTGSPCNPKSMFNGLQVYVPKTSFVAGCDDVPCQSDNRVEDAIGVSRKAEVVVKVAGPNLTEETEDRDRTSLLLPGKHMDLVIAIVGVNKKPLVLVLTGGGPLDISFAKANPWIASILWIGYPGEVGGQALAEALVGVVESTWYVFSCNILFRCWSSYGGAAKPLAMQFEMIFTSPFRKYLPYDLGD